MDVTWMSTPSGTWVCVVEQYHGIVTPMSGHWVARVEDSNIVEPGEVRFRTLDAAKAWVEQKLAELVPCPSNS